MSYEETRRRISGAKHAVLFLHGIVGTPDQFRLLIPLEETVPPDWTVYNLCYPGHGGEVHDFGRSRMEQWRDYSRGAFLELAESHERVLIVGHSMGTLFAIQLACEFPEKVSGLFLLNVPMRPWMRLFCMGNCLRIAFGRLRPDHPREACFGKACGVKPTPLVWRYIPWIPRVMELFAEIIRTERILEQLRVPCAAFQSRKDDLVSNLSSRVLRKNKVIDVHQLPHSTHFYYTPEDQTRIFEAFSQMIKKISC